MSKHLVEATLAEICSEVLGKLLDSTKIEYVALKFAIAKMVKKTITAVRHDLKLIGNVGVC